MAAAATASAALGARACVSAASPLLRRGRGRRRRPRGGREERRDEAAEAGGPGCCCRACPPGPGRPDSLGRRQQQPPPPPGPSSGGEPPTPAPSDRGAALRECCAAREGPGIWVQDRGTIKLHALPDCVLCFTSFRRSLFSADFIFRAPITLNKPGELHEEYRSQLRKLRDEKLQEERTPEDFIHKLIFEDAEAGRRKAEVQKKEESSAVKMTQEHFPERLSDSENEEPFQGKSGHRSAFVSKGNSYSLALLTGNLGSKVERSQSCNDTLRERSKSRQRSTPVRTKVNLLMSVSTPVAGVLSSTQNNRCLSAPDLTADKRAGLGAATSLSILPKPERSISPESNDSISEELNHFKPIVCSPCTPPKRLPDGRVLSPLIIKSTPRNLTRSLQKPTTYEASPRILRKWEQILQERQVKKTLSKATLTSSAPETGEDFPDPNVNIIKELPHMSNDFLAPKSIVRTHAESDCFPSPCGAKLESSDSIKRDAEAADDSPAASTGRTVEATHHARVSEASCQNSALFLAGSGLSADAKMGTRKAIGVHAAFLENGTLGPSVKAAGKKQLKYLNGSERSNLPNGICPERVRGEEPASLRWGRKRQCKTKHLEHSCSAKRLRQGVAEPLRRSQAQQKRQQEEEDRRLALQLQWKFDRENRRVARRKGRTDHYFLRSKSTVGAK
uniref:E3 ubiquitin-protein ligase RNF169 n=1 Tax=Euleptes europaea TaxID=460621 RepID=UPI002541A2EF|nr:E3 ubiquitin-protein ligase RNF169 [Euleptes europaea]